MTKLIGISGSLRKGSFNSALLRTAASLAPQDIDFVIGTIEGIPLYNADIEAEDGIPLAVQTLKEGIMAADGVILFTPEYNNSIPGVFKNAIDWLSRPSSDIGKVFGGRLFALAGTSPGNFGTMLSQNAWLSVLHTLGADIWSKKRLMIPRASTLFDENLTLTDDATVKRLSAFVEAFASAAAAKAG